MGPFCDQGLILKKIYHSLQNRLRGKNSCGDLLAINTSYHGNSKVYVYQLNQRSIFQTWEIMMWQHLRLRSCPPALESVNSAHSLFKPTMSAGAQLHIGKLDLDQHVWIHEKKKTVHCSQSLSRSTKKVSFLLTYEMYFAKSIFAWWIEVEFWVFFQKKSKVLTCCINLAGEESTVFS